MDEPNPVPDDLDADACELLRRVAVFADRHGLSDACLMRQFGAYLRATQLRREKHA